jgi:preprotein translocase subunit SecG
LSGSRSNLENSSFENDSIMQIWMTLLLAVQILSALVMIGLVLVQHGKGADMGASFGSGSSGSLFGATGSANFLSRSTAVCATVFFVSTLLLALTSNQAATRAGGGTSVLDRPAAAAGAASAASSPAAGVIPGAAPAPGTMQPAPSAVPAPVAASGSK